MEMRMTEQPKQAREKLPRLTDAQARVNAWVYLLAQADCLGRPPTAHNLAIKCGLGTTTVCEHWANLIDRKCITNEFRAFASAEQTAVGEKCAVRWIKAHESDFPVEYRQYAGLA